MSEASVDCDSRCHQVAQLQQLINGNKTLEKFATRIDHIQSADHSSPAS